ncbi:MAG TPA: permease prefix domain 1-containing protein [Pyrinomonadaceae bacterium]
MRDLTRKLFDPIGGKAIEREVEEELRFHLEMLTEQHLQQAATPVEARAFALRRFGDVEQVTNQCVEISKRMRPFARALKSFLILIFLAGIFVRIFGTELHVDRVGQMLITVAVMGRLFLYVRGLKPARFRPKSDTTSHLMLNSTAKTPTSLFEADNL